jgi:predicted pyridoxine 5'-phosphate oxidase superfamily flavin-nucleotide-binding protein
MPQQHRDFFENLPMLFLGLLDSTGRPWCVPAFGPPGFLVSPTSDTLEIHRDPVLSHELGLDRSPGASVGMVGIDLTNRRRNRLNGRIQHASTGEMTIVVDQSFGNCPQYIQTRPLPPTSQDEPTAASRRRGSITDPEVRRIIEAADTFFIASRAAGSLDGGSAGVDASHRGGRPGFLGINGDGTLSFPDFSGNRFFNTLGNIESDGRVSLFVPDFETGEAVMLTGRGSIDWNPDRIKSFEGAERIVDVVPEEIWHANAALPVIGTISEQWPGLDTTGTWNEARLAVLKTGGYRRFQIASKLKESDNITSFYLTPADGGPIEPHLAGQFLPIRLQNNDEVIQRSYTISQGPNGQNYRLSVKREDYGLASRLLHDHCENEDIIEVGSPAGDFVLGATLYKHGASSAGRPCSRGRRDRILILLRPRVESQRQSSTTRERQKIPPPRLPGRRAGSSEKAGVTAPRPGAWRPGRRPSDFTGRSPQRQHAGVSPGGPMLPVRGGHRGRNRTRKPVRPMWHRASRVFPVHVV